MSSMRVPILEGRGQVLPWLSHGGKLRSADLLPQLRVRFCGTLGNRGLVREMVPEEAQA